MAVGLLLPGCASQDPWVRRQGPSERIGNSMARAGAVAAAGAGGYAAGKSVGGQAGAAVGAGVGVAGAMAMNGFHKRKMRDAYEAGLEDGTDAARAEILDDKWKREAVYGCPDQGDPKAAASPRYRNVYVPSRTVNGVEYPGGNQTVVVGR